MIRCGGEDSDGDVSKIQVSLKVHVANDGRLFSLGGETSTFGGVAIPNIAMESRLCLGGAGKAPDLSGLPDDMERQVIMFEFIYIVRGEEGLIRRVEQSCLQIAGY